MIAALITFALLLSVNGASPSTAATAPPAGFARVHHAVSTHSALAQQFFDQGLTLVYGYNRRAAHAAFENAAAADAHLAIAYWGVALADAPNINEPMDADSVHDAAKAIAKAEQLAQYASPEERDLIAALKTRSTADPKPDFDALAKAYNGAMRDVVQRFPDDLDVAALFAESGLDLKPWQQYTPHGDPVEGTAEVVTTLEAILARDPDHIGALHYYIHATEGSRTPGRALLAAKTLHAMNFEPTALHLVHMPGHTFMRVGDYQSAVDCNAVLLARLRELERAKKPFFKYAYYHMPLFLTEAAGMEGDYGTARGAADAMQDHGFMTGLLFTLMRFDRWQEILTTKQPAASEDEPFIVQQWQFARGMADAASGRLDEANLLLIDLAQADRSMNIATGPAREGSHGTLGLAQAVLGAKIAWAAGRHDDAIAGFTKAVAIQDEFAYAEPPEWYAPEREALGAALLQAGHAQAAEQTFRDDLDRNARNPRSLFGLMKSLEAQGRSEDARYVESEFKAAWHGNPGLTLADL